MFESIYQFIAGQHPVVIFMIVLMLAVWLVFLGAFLETFIGGGEDKK